MSNGFDGPSGKIGSQQKQTLTVKNYYKKLSKQLEKMKQIWNEQWI